jgi:hypothetical protein
MRRKGVDVPGGIHQHNLARGARSDDVNEVLHRADLQLFDDQFGRGHGVSAILFGSSVTDGYERTFKGHDRQ